MVTYFHG